MYACMYVRTYIQVHVVAWTMLLSKSAMVDGGLLLSNLQVAEEVANTAHDLGKDCEEMLPKRSTGHGGLTASRRAECEDSKAVELDFVCSVSDAADMQMAECLLHARNSLGAM